MARKTKQQARETRQLILDVALRLFSQQGVSSTSLATIAKAAGVPIVLMYANSKTKQGGIFGKIYPSDLDQDLAEIKRLYKEHTGLDIVIPEEKNH